MDLKLSKNFRLSEFLVSQTAARHGIDMTPSDEVIENLIRLVADILQPLRDEVGPIFVSSGYRPPDLNSLIGGSKTSMHQYGCAADIRAIDLTPLELATRIRDMRLPYDQLIHEFDRWVHVGISREGVHLRKQDLTAYKDPRNRTRYTHGLHPTDVLV